MTRQISLLVIMLLAASCATNKDATRAPQNTGNPEMETVVLDKVAPLPLAGEGCSVSLPAEFMVDPTLTTEQSNFDILVNGKGGKQSVGSMERTTPLTGNFTSFNLKAASNGRVMGTASYPRGHSLIRVFDCDNVKVGSISHKGDEVKLQGVDGRVLVGEFIGSSAISFNNSKGNQVILAKKTKGEFGRDQWSISVNEQNPIDGRLVLFFIANKSFVEDLKNEQ